MSTASPTDTDPNTAPETRASLGTGIRTRALRKAYGRTPVLHDIDLDLAPGRVYGLLGANGVGKTTLMAVLVNHTFRSGGTVEIDGEDPAENAPVLARTCFIHEDQRWHDDYHADQVLAVMPSFHPQWDERLADRLLHRFGVPRRTALKKLSRGQRSGFAIALSLASRAPYTFLDEPHLGLDATARGIFYEELMREIAERPRTVIMSTHLIDEAASLLDQVLLMRGGRIEMQADVDEITASMTVVRGLDSAVDPFVAGRDVISSQSLGRIRSVLLRERLSPADARRAEELHLSVESAGLQDIVAAMGILDHPGAEHDDVPHPPATHPAKETS
ncbi:MAG: ABC transporter ATP-binding protein [Brachybacterium sp.]|nr:ABC transporter ATP-binding protein [Brachybacterium sp.]